MVTKFKDIPWYEWLYKIDNKWNVISNTYNSRNKLLKQYNNSCWYKYVVLSKNNSIKRFSAHRLVMLTYVWESKLQVNHINWIKSDNRLENLEYVTQSENMKHSYKLWLQKPITKWVACLDNDWLVIKEYNSIADACRDLWLYSSNIIKAINGWYSHTGWFKWKYL